MGDINNPKFGGKTPENVENPGRGLPRSEARPITENAKANAQSILSANKSPEELRKDEILNVYKQFFSFHRTDPKLSVDDEWLNNMTDHFKDMMDHDGFDFVNDTQKPFGEDTIEWIGNFFLVDMNRYLNKNNNELIKFDTQAVKRFGEQILTNLERNGVHIKKRD